MISAQLYGVDVRRMRLREVLRFVPGPKGALSWALLQVRVARAPVKFTHRVLALWADTLSTWEAIRPADATMLRQSIDELLDCGYVGVAVHQLSEPFAQTDGAGAYLLHRSGLSFAFVGYVTNAESGEALLATHVGSALTGGRLVSTTNQRNVLDNSFTDNHWVNAERSGEVVRTHAERIRTYEGSIHRVADGAELARLIDSFTVRAFDENVERGVFVVSAPQDHHTAGVYRV